MKICWDSLEEIILTKNKTFYKGKTTYIYKNACKRCGEPYLTEKKVNSNFCCRACANKKDYKFEYKCETCGKDVLLEGKQARWAIEQGRKHCPDCRYKAVSNKISGKNNGNFIHGQRNTLGYINYMSRLHSYTKRNQTPILTENEKRKIKVLYQIAGYLGSDWHVDHKIPLSKGGLHHPDNLWIIPKTDNLKKNNNENYKLEHNLYFEL